MNTESIVIDWSLAATIVFAITVAWIIKELWNWIVWDRQRGDLGAAVDLICNALNSNNGILAQIKETVSSIDGTVDNIRHQT